MRRDSLPSARASLLTRWLEPIAASLWTLFLLLSLAVGVIWAGGIGDAWLEKSVSNTGLRAALSWLLLRLDVLWITLAAANAYLALAGREGLPVARRWGLTVLVTVVLLGWVSVVAGYPLGRIVYGPALGMKIGPVPIGLPFLWFSVILGSRELVLRLLPRLGHALTAILAGLAGAVTDLNLEPVAAKLRGFWFWRANVAGDPPIFDAPLQSALVWGLTTALIVFLGREVSVVASARPRAWKPVLILAIFHVVFLAAHWGRAVRG